MSFGNNLVNLRKKTNMTQEQLADTLYVSRQTVSRWETDSTLPDVDMLVRICDMFGCDLDTLVRGEISCGEADTAYADAELSASAHESHYKSFAMQIALGVALIIFGVSALLFTYSVSEVLAVALLLGFITFAVAIFIIAGTKHSAYLSDFDKGTVFPDGAGADFKKKLPYIFAAAVCLILVGVIFLTVFSATLTEAGNDTPYMIANGIFLILIAVSASTFTYAGIRSSAFSPEDEEDSKMSPKGKRIAEAVSSVIMMLATAIFLLLGFLGGLWHPAWVAFPIGGILSGIAKSVVAAIYPERAE